MDELIREKDIETFLSFVVKEFPRICREHPEEITPRCNRCILSSNAAPLTAGLCPACKESPAPVVSLEAPRSAEKSLDTEFSTICASPASSHDLLHLLSGGKDSVYLLHQLRTRYPNLRILCLMVDNGFASPIAVRNAKIAAQKCETDFIVVQPRPKLFQSAFRHALLVSDAASGYASVDRIDGDLTFDIGRTVAARMRIPWVTSGISPAQVQEIFGPQPLAESANFGSAPRESSGPLSVLGLRRKDDGLSFWSGNPSPELPAPRMLFPFVWWGYDEAFIRAEVGRLDLTPSGDANPLKTNNDLIPLILARDVYRLGYTGFEPEFARLVRTGKAPREEWLNFFAAVEYQVRLGKFLPNIIASTLKKLEILPSQMGFPESTTKEKEESC